MTFTFYDFLNVSLWQWDESEVQDGSESDWWAAAGGTSARSIRW